MPAIARRSSRTVKRLEDPPKVGLGDADAGTRANFGASPGDASIPEPYLYVGPWDEARRTGFGAVRPNPQMLPALIVTARSCLILAACL